MEVAVVGSRNILVHNLEAFLPEDTDELVSGGARGVDSCVREYALEKNIPLTEFLPEYGLYGRGAPIRRNFQIIEYADVLIAFWDGKSRGTKMVIDTCRKYGETVHVHMM